MKETMMSETGPLMANAIEEYLDCLAHERHASRSTRLGYQAALRRFLRHVAGSRGAEPSLAEITAEDVRGYLYALSRRGLRPRTLRGAIHLVRGLFAMAVERGYL